VKRNNPVTVYLTDDEKAQLKEWAREAGKSVSELSRDAILEFTDKDRFARIEDKLDRVLSEMDGGEHTHTVDSRQKSVPETAREIAKRLYNNHEPPIRDTDVELAIEDLGGGSDRIVEQYKTQLKKRGLLYKHPAQPVWTDQKKEWVKWNESAKVDVDVHESTEPYRMDSDEYIGLADELEQ